MFKDYELKQLKKYAKPNTGEIVSPGVAFDPNKDLNARELEAKGSLSKNSGEDFWSETLKTHEKQMLHG